MLHTVLFCTMPIEESCEAIVAYIDLETNSLDVLSGDILEIGALIDGSRSMFSTVINPGHGASADDPSVHGIQSEELRWGPCFRVAFERLELFLKYASLSAVESDDSEDDGSPAASMKQSLEVALVAHNGTKFDFPFLLGSCLRSGVGSAAMSNWIYVDTLDVLRATDQAGECMKLQCAFRSCSGPASLRAHRALDDCIALEAVVRHVSVSLGIKPWALLRRFASRLDETAAVAQVSALVS